jgi:hypothetical protein
MLRVPEPQGQALLLLAPALGALAVAHRVLWPRTVVLQGVQCVCVGRARAAWPWPIALPSPCRPHAHSILAPMGSSLGPAAPVLWAMCFTYEPHL